MCDSFVDRYMSASTLGLRYFFFVFNFFKKDIQKYVAAMTNFLMKQSVIFTSIYDGPLRRDGTRLS